MKRCPQCGREYDSSMMFCLDDGAELLYGPGAPDEPATALLSEPGAAATGFLSEPGAVETGFPDGESSTQIYSGRGEAEPPERFGSSPERQSLSAHRAAQPQDGSFGHRAAQPYAGRSATRATKPLLIVSGVAIIALVSFFGYRYFSAAGSGTISSIAVLPFENRSGNADSEYLSDGLSDSLIYRLTQLPNLKVSPTSSVIRYKGKQNDVAEIARELEVDAVMFGKLAQRGDALTISVELIDARTKKLIWAEQYDRKMADLLATQREIATTITEKLQLKLAGDESKGITKKYTDNNEAYQLYLRGRYSFGKRTKDEMLRAVGYFEQAIKLDPNFALAYARIAETYGSMPAYPYLSPKEAFPKAKSAALRALEIDPTLSEAHTFLAYCLAIYDWNWAEAERSFKRAIELDPNNSAAHFRYGQIYLMPTGRFDEGIAEIKRGLDLEPLDMNMGGTLASAYFFAGRNDQALEQARKTHEIEPGHPIGRWILSQAYLVKEMYTDAIAHNENWLLTEPANQFALRDAGIAYAKTGRRDKAEEMIRRFREIEKAQYVPTSRIACIYAALGDMDKGFAELTNGFEARDWELYRSNVEPYMYPFRDDARFKDLVKRLNLPQ
jgi:TolB-like protein/Flp pilus assembly protein TadD